MSVPYPLAINPGSQPFTSSGEILDRFLAYVAERNLELYPAQESAILELYDDKNVILNTPTGSGKSLVATALHFKSVAQGCRSVYTCPIKALVNEKFMALCRDFGPENVGMTTGDASVNRDAPILCCTAEILSNIALHEGDRARIHHVIMDEFHYYSDRERGVAWQVPLLTLPQARFLLMSATLGDTAFFQNELTALTGRETVTVQSQDRPVPLSFNYVDIPIDQTVQKLMEGSKAPVYIVHFTQLDAAETAQNLMCVDFCSKEQKGAIAERLEGVRFSSPYGKEIKKYLRHGVGLHHAGLLPKYRILVEQLAQAGLLKIICGTDTLGVGVNVPIRTVLFTRLCKYDGEKTAILSARDFHQISGRAGRKGFDEKGWVVIQAPEHVTENKRLEQKHANDPAKLRKIVKRKPPEKGYVAWDEATFNRLIAAKPEALQSRFQVTHGMLLLVLSRPDAGHRAMQRLIRSCHDSPNAKKQHRKRAWQLFRSLLDRKIIEIIQPSPEGSRLRVNVELQEDFSLHYTLSLYCLDTIQLLERNSPEYGLNLLTLVESICEDPDIILRRQLDRVKSEALAEMKAAGMEYEERMAKLEELEYPKPQRDFIYGTFNQFSDKHPWVGEENIRPKSVAREMFEKYMSFSDYIHEYELEKAEGVLLRYLSSVYKILVQTVPDPMKDEVVQEMITYFGGMLRQVDSSLLDEWERMRDPNWKSRIEEEQSKPESREITDITRDVANFTRMIRNEIFSFVRALASKDYESAASMIHAEHEISSGARALDSIMKPYFADHQRIRLDPAARNAGNTYVKVSEDRTTWKVDQVLVDPDEHNDWILEFFIPLDKSREAGKPILVLHRIGPVAE